ncbi:MAG: magnesium transporter [Clostridia bacterium]|nr:magnesium transporter [Clostridia bacterium]
MLLHSLDLKYLKPLLAEMNAIDAARALEAVEEEDLPLLFRLLPKDLAAEAFVEIDSDKQETLIGKLNNLEIHRVMNDLFLDDIADILEEMPANVVKKLLAGCDKETRSRVNELLKYPKDSAGSIMTVEFVSLHPTMTVDQAFDKIRKTAIDKETIYTCYVVDEKNYLVGIVSAKELLLSQKDSLIEDVMETNFAYAVTTDDKEQAANLLKEYSLLAIPVVDEEKRLVGIVTVDDAIDVIEEENTEDIEKMAAILPSEKPYLKTSVFSIWLKRIPWLLILMVSATFTGLILNTYEGKLALISTVLFACVPMIMDTGGNAGSQASVTVIRALALNELSTKDAFRVLWKETRASILLGLTLALACFGKLMLVDNLIFGYADYTPFTCFVVSLALACTVVVAKLVGCTLPLLAKKAKLDPAVVASPFITTVVDAVSLIVYCALAVALLGN